MLTILSKAERRICSAFILNILCCVLQQNTAEMDNPVLIIVSSVVGRIFALQAYTVLEKSKCTLKFFDFFWLKSKPKLEAVALAVLYRIS